MITTMRLFRQSLELLKSHADEMISVFDLVEVLDLRLRHIESHLGIPCPDDLVLLQKIEDRKEHG